MDAAEVQNRPKFSSHVSINIIRWLVALLVTASLIYPLLKMMVFISLRGYPQKNPLIHFVLGLFVSFVLTVRLHRRERWNRLQVFSTSILMFAWIAVSTVIGTLVIDPSVGNPVYLGATFGICTLAVPWSAWFMSWTSSFVTRVFVLIVLLAGIPLLYSVARFDGVSGQADLFAVGWRRDQPSKVIPIETEGHSNDWRDYPQYLGPNRDALIPDLEIDTDWEHKPPRCLWRILVGSGLGAFAISQDHAVTQEQHGDQETIQSYHLLSGKSQWEVSYDGNFSHGLARSGPRATPTISDGRVFTMGALGSLCCIDLATGELVWRKETIENGVPNLAYGVSSSPLIIDNMVIVCPPSTDGRSVAAYDRENGKLLWLGGNANAGYSSPILCELAGKRQIVVYNSTHIAGIRPKDGSVLWSHPWTNNEANCSQPVIGAGGIDQVFLSTGYGKGATLIKVIQDDAGKFNVESLWTSNRMRNKFATSICVDNVAYGLDEGILSALDLDSGTKLWKRGRYGHGQCLMIGENLLVIAENGDLVVVKPSREGVKEEARLENALDGKTWNHAAFAAPYLLLRNENEAACFSLPMLESATPNPDDAVGR